MTTTVEAPHAGGVDGREVEAARRAVLAAAEDVECALSSVAEAERAHTAAEVTHALAIAAFAELSSPADAAESLNLPLATVRHAMRQAGLDELSGGHTESDVQVRWG